MQVSAIKFDMVTRTRGYPIIIMKFLGAVTRTGSDGVSTVAFRFFSLWGFHGEFLILIGRFVCEKNVHFGLLEWFCLSGLVVVS